MCILVLSYNNKAMPQSNSVCCTPGGSNNHRLSGSLFITIPQIVKHSLVVHFMYIWFVWSCKFVPGKFQLIMVKLFSTQCCRLLDSTNKKWKHDFIWSNVKCSFHKAMAFPGVGEACVYRSVYQPLLQYIN